MQRDTIWAGVQLSNPLIYLVLIMRSSLVSWGSTLKSLDILVQLRYMAIPELGFNSQIP